MASVSSRAQLIEYCKRRLGEPVIVVNVDDEQVEDRIDDALAYFQEYHFDGVQLNYLRHNITDEDRTNRYITIPNYVTGVNKILPVNRTSASAMFDVQYQWFMNDLWDFSNVQLTNYTISMTHLRSLQMMFNAEPSIRFNRLQDRLYIDFNWETKLAGVDVIIIECYTIIDPDTYTDVYNDRWLKKYATALIKRQWGENLKKFGNVSLPGGVFLNGQQIYEEAVREIEDIEDRIQSAFELPVDFQIG